MAGRDYVLALDQGTTSSRSILFDRDATIVASAQKEFGQHYPRSGWVEHDSVEIWSSQRATMAEVLAKAGVQPRQLAAIGITNQRETALAWDAKTGLPITNAIVWQDRRTAAACESLRQEGVQAEVSRLSGLRIDPYFSATKWRWILENVPAAQQLADSGRLRLGTVDSWLIWKLTEGAVHVTDASNASRTLLCGLESGNWHTRLLDIFGVPVEALPRVVDSSGVAGEWDGVPIAGIAGDQQAALFGQGCWRLGQAKNTYGTGCFLLMHTGETPIRSKNNLLTTIAWRMAGVTEYALEGSVFVGGALFQWLRDELNLVSSAMEVDQLAAAVADSDGCVFVPAFVGLGAPYWDPHVRGGIFGLTRATSNAHLCRAALEAVALQSVDLAECMVKDAGHPLREMRVDGGASRSDLLMQIQADLLGLAITRPAQVESTALGAAMLAGLAVGFWSGREEVAALIQQSTVFKPQIERPQVEELRENWRQAIALVRGWSGS